VKSCACSKKGGGGGSKGVRRDGTGKWMTGTRVGDFICDHEPRGLGKDGCKERMSTVHSDEEALSERKEAMVMGWGPMRYAVG
jgi:hypothetical protein